MLIMSISKMEATKVRRHFAEEMSKVAYGKQRLVIERNGKPLVAVVPIEDLALLEEYEAQREERDDVKAYEAAKAEMERTGDKPIPWERFKRAAGDIVAPIRRGKRSVKRGK